MNYTLSVGVNRKDNKCGWVIMQGGAIKSEKISSFTGESVRGNLLKQIALGLRECRRFVSHNDLLIIELPIDRYLNGWLVRNGECKDYLSELDNVFAKLDSLDCRYKYSFIKNPFIKKYMCDRGYTLQEYSSVDDLFV